MCVFSAKVMSRLTPRFFSGCNDWMRPFPPPYIIVVAVVKLFNFSTPDRQYWFEYMIMLYRQYGRTPYIGSRHHNAQYNTRILVHSGFLLYLLTMDLGSWEIYLIQEHIQRQNWGTLEPCNILKNKSTFKVELLAASVTDYSFEYFDTKDDKQKDGEGNFDLLWGCEPSAWIWCLL